MALAALGHAYAGAGKIQEAEELLQQLKTLAATGYPSSVNSALIALGIGDHDFAFAELERALAARAGWLVFLRVDPRFDSVRSDRRFENLLQSLFSNSDPGN
jgi:serine/threonine-protein kinase